MSTAATRMDATRRAARSCDDGQLEAQQLGDLPDAADLVADPERDMVCRALGAPVVEEARRIPREANSRVRVADAERRARDRLTLGREELESTVGGLGEPEDRDRPEPDLHLDGEARARLPVVQA